MLSLLAATLSAQQGRSSANEALAAATKLIQQGQPAAAAALLHKALTASPRDPRLHTAEGVAYSLQGKDSEALRCFQAAVSIDPGFLRALQGEAAVLARQHDPAVIPVLQQILKKDPGDQTAAEMLGLAEAQEHRCTEALAAFAQAGAGLEAHTTSLEYEGACLLEGKAYTQAIQVLETVQRLRPGDRSAAYDLALAQSQAGDPRAAAATLKPLLGEQPDVDTLLLAADVFEQEGDTPEAAATLRQAIVAEPTRANSYVRFAELCMAHESYKAGVDMVTAGLVRSPHDASLFLARGLLYGGLADYDKAEADFRSAAEFDSRHGTGSYAVGLVEAQRNDPQGALRTVRTALTSHPEDAQLHFLLARLLMEAGAQPGTTTYAEATQSALEAVRLQPGLVSAHDLLARIYMEAGQPGQAIVQCRAALALDPDDSNALYRLMRSLRATGDSKGAQAIAQQVAAQHQQARDAETGRLRYRIEEAPPAGLDHEHPQDMGGAGKR